MSLRTKLGRLRLRAREVELEVLDVDPGRSDASSPTAHTPSQSLRNEAMDAKQWTNSFLFAKKPGNEGGGAGRALDGDDDACYNR